jgi:hypothetical protein
MGSSKSVHKVAIQQMQRWRVQRARRHLHRRGLVLQHAVVVFVVAADRDDGPGAMQCRRGPHPGGQVGAGIDDVAGQDGDIDIGAIGQRQLGTLQVQVGQHQQLHRQRRST